MESPRRCMETARLWNTETKPRRERNQVKKSKSSLLLLRQSQHSCTTKTETFLAQPPSSESQSLFCLKAVSQRLLRCGASVAHFYGSLKTANESRVGRNLHNVPCRDTSAFRRRKRRELEQICCPFKGMTIIQIVSELHLIFPAHFPSTGIKAERFLSFLVQRVYQTTTVCRDGVSSGLWFMN